MIDLNPNAPPPTPPTKPPAALVGVIVLVCIAAFAGGVFTTNLWEKMRETEPETEETYPVVEEEGEVVEEMEDVAPPEFVKDSQVLTIDWIEPTRQPLTADDPAFGEAVCFEESEEGEPFYLCEGDPANIAIGWSYKLGTVRGGTYEGRELIITTVPMAGLGISYQSFYILRDPVGREKPVLLERLYREAGDWYPGADVTMTASVALGSRVDQLSGYVIDTEASIPDLDIETTLHHRQDGDTNRLVFTGYWVRLYSDLAISLTSAKTSITTVEGETLYLYEPKVDAEGNVLDGQTSVGRNQFYAVDEDGRVLFYDLAVLFYERDVDKEGIMTSYGSGTPTVRWNDGSTNETVYYKGAVGGCGFATVTNVVAQETIDTLGLTPAGFGVADTVEYAVYEPVSYDMDYYDDAFTIVTWEQEGEDPKTYDDFSHPFFYFQDSFGRWIEFMSQEIVPPVECGKPVIYLYPESTMDMSVWVKPRGGFSYTEPEYGDGWEVTAFPDGRIVNRQDGLEYPYLFWEGRGGLYPQVQTYWVVEQAGVESFLRETLAQMNFNQSEIADFVEFWLPRMQAASFYKIGFHGTTVMNELAPLKLSVKPDHVFRVLMDYEELDTWQPSKPPARLPRANRDGFEVMEWGGVLR